MQYARVLKRWLKTEGLSPVEAAPRFAVRFQTFYRWLDGETLPPATRIPSLAQALGVPQRKLRRIIDADREEREARKHAADPVADAPAATVDEPAANGGAR